MDIEWISFLSIQYMSIEELERRFNQVQIERFDPEKLLDVITNVNESLRPTKRNLIPSNLKKLKRLTSLQSSVSRFVRNLPKYEKNKFEPYVANRNRRLSYGRARTARISKKALSMIRNTNTNASRNALRSRAYRPRASRRSLYQ